MHGTEAGRGIRPAGVAAKDAEAVANGSRTAQLRLTAQTDGGHDRALPSLPVTIFS